MMEMKLYFSELADKRDNRGLRHDLGNIIVMSIYAVLCGYTDAENMAFFMKLQEPYFEKMLDLKYGVPSADTLLLRVCTHRTGKIYGAVLSMDQGCTVSTSEK